MKLGILAACALFAAATAGAQGSCVTSQAVIDSARDEALSVLTSDRPLVVELRQEQNIADKQQLSDVSAVRDREVCSKMAAAFGRLMASGMRLTVLKIGPLYYARDPDQRRGTGVITDSTFKVLMRLGAAVPAKD